VYITTSRGSGVKRSASEARQPTAPPTRELSADSRMNHARTLLRENPIARRVPTSRRRLETDAYMVEEKDDECDPEHGRRGRRRERREAS